MKWNTCVLRDTLLSLSKLGHGCAGQSKKKKQAWNRIILRIGHIYELPVRSCDLETTCCVSYCKKQSLPTPNSNFSQNWGPQLLNNTDNLSHRLYYQLWKRSHLRFSNPATNVHSSLWTQFKRGVFLYVFFPTKRSTFNPILLVKRSGYEQRNIFCGPNPSACSEHAKRVSRFNPLEKPSSTKVVDRSPWAISSAKFEGENTTPNGERPVGTNEP